MPIDDPIVVATRCNGKTLQIVCPHCGRRHWHGAGDATGIYLGHRLAHCVDSHGAGYDIVDGSLITEKAMRSLFAEMDQAADTMRDQAHATGGHVRRDDLQIEFR